MDLVEFHQQTKGRNPHDRDVYHKRTYYKYEQNVDGKYISIGKTAKRGIREKDTKPKRHIKITQCKCSGCHKIFVRRLRSQRRRNKTLKNL